jgi:hypothetical protein
MKALYVLFLGILANFMSYAQNPTPGSFNVSAETDGEYIVIKVTPTGVSVPAGSLLTGLNVYIIWPTAYGVDLDVSSIISPTLQMEPFGPKGTIGANEVRSFYVANPKTVGPWTSPTEVMRIKTTLNSTTNLVGDFTIHPYEPNLINAGPPGNIDPSPYIEFNTNGYIMDPTTAAIAVPLPIELLSFDVNAGKESIDLRWATAKEENFRGFEVERSLDAKNYEKIGFIAGKNARGAEYTLEDRTALKNKRYYYRLKIVNSDGSFDYSLVRNAMIETNPLTGVTIFPNPSNGDVNLKFNVEADVNTIVDVIDMAGKNVFRKEAWAIKGENLISLELLDLPSGVYTVRMNMDGKIVNKLVRLATK